MVAAEAGPNAVDLLEGVDQPRLRQVARGEPTGDKGKASNDDQHGNDDHREPDQGAFIDERPKPIWCRLVRIISHPTLPGSAEPRSDRRTPGYSDPLRRGAMLAQRLKIARRR
jgi:hypothetical protein